MAFDFEISFCRRKHTHTHARTILTFYLSLLASTFLFILVLQYFWAVAFDYCRLSSLQKEKFFLLRLESCNPYLYFFYDVTRLITSFRKDYMFCLYNLFILFLYNNLFIYYLTPVSLLNICLKESLCS